MAGAQGALPAGLEQAADAAADSKGGGAEGLREPDHAPGCRPPRQVTREREREREKEGARARARECESLILHQAADPHARSLSLQGYLARKKQHPP